MSKYTCLIGFFIILSASGSLIASDSVSYPDFSLSQNHQESTVFTASLWRIRSELQYNKSASVFWNQKYRTEVGQISILPLELISYDYNNKTEKADAGSINEYHSMIQLRAAFYRNFCVYLGGGYSILEIDQSTDSAETFERLYGYHFSTGLEAGFPLGRSFTIELMGEWKTWEGASSINDSRNYVYGHRMQFQIMFLFEIFGGNNTSALNIGIGAGLHYYHEIWTINETEYTISPNNTNSLDNGSEAYDVIAALYYSIGHFVNIGVEVKPLGIFEARIVFSFIFM
ncbi:MAG: hypothetical protein K8S87_09420 [Planctomycetes bacterium]|nr:hypothetical protein [Planctomycetota bacterium]